MSEISTSSQADSERSMHIQMLSMSQTDPGTFQELCRIQGYDPSDAIIRTEEVLLTDEASYVINTDVLGLEGYAAIESTKVSKAVGGIATKRGLWMSSAQIAADQGDYYDF